MENQIPNQQHKKIITFLSLGVIVLVGYFLLGATGLLMGDTYETAGKICIPLAMLYGGYALYLMSQAKPNDPNKKPDSL